MGQAQAQDIPDDTAFDVQLFDHAIGPKSFVTVNDGTIQRVKQFSLDFLVTFLTKPFTVYNVSEGCGTDPICSGVDIETERTNVVSSLVAGQLSGAYGLHEKFHLGVQLPVIFTMNGDGLDPETAMATEGYRVAGLGDLRVELKAKLYDKDRLSFTAAPVVTVPTSFGGNGGDFMGDDLPTFRGYGAGMWKHATGKYAVGANVGFIVRKPREIYASDISHQLTWGLAGLYKVTETVDLVAETFGRTGLTNFGESHASPFEVAGSAKFRIGQAIQVLAGGGAGIGDAIGTPKLRFFAAIGWAPDFADDDGDGIGNMEDRCPLVAEDKDGFEDSDGCPDPDNDGDLRNDDVDKCPNEKEDKDGFEDDDGCPEPDNDLDGFLDGKDQCPQDKEDGLKPFPKDGCPANKTDVDQDGVFDNVDQCPEEEEDMDDFDDWDGCPDPDNDGDGLADDEDECSLCREDKDGFDDEDGCPELDNDQDGVADSKDKCPTEAETINGIKDKDGCPDTGRSLASLEGDRITYKGAIKFKRNRLVRGSVKLVSQISSLMGGQTMVTKWRLVVALPRGTKSDTEIKIKAQARAQQVKNMLVANGVPPDRVEAVGVGADRELIAFSVIERAQAQGTVDFCPAGYEAVQKPKPTAGVSPVAATPEGPKDSDGDGVLDNDDLCPNQAGLATAKGCPDRDGDTIADRYDNCPDEAGTTENAGCKTKQLVVIKGNKLEIKEAVFFRTGRARIRSKSYKLLDNVAAVLKSKPSFKIRVEGHTDNQGRAAKNKALSKRRAQAVVKYLVKKGIGRDRLTAEGFGDETPIADNGTKVGRAQNRRVVFSIVGGPAPAPTEP